MRRGTGKNKRINAFFSCDFVTQHPEKDTGVFLFIFFYGLLETLSTKARKDNLCNHPVFQVLMMKNL
jgi:hypothetical protein